MKAAKEKRIRFAILFLIIFVIECIIAIYIKDDFIRPYVGDMLVVVLIYYFIRIFFPEGLCLLPLYVFIFAAAVEVLQYIHLVDLLHLGQYKVARIILGATFDVKDILCYGAGCVLIWLWENRTRIVKLRRRN